MRTWHQWDFARDPDAPLSWPDPEKRIVLCEPLDGDVPYEALFIAASDAMAHGAALVVPASDDPHALRVRDALGNDGAVPALLVRRQADFYGVHALNRVQSEHKALLIEPEEALDLDPPVCPDCGRLEFVTGTDGATPFCAECDGMAGDGQEMCYGSILDPLNEGVALVIVRGREKPIHPDWVRTIRDECKAAGVAFCFLGWGAWSPDRTHHNGCRYEDMVLFSTFENGDAPIYLRDLEEHRRDNWAYWHNRDDVFMYRVGPERSGRMLDGREWLKMPEGL